MTLSGENWLYQRMNQESNQTVMEETFLENS